MKTFISLLCAHIGLLLFSSAAIAISEDAQKAADYASKHYQQDMVSTLADLVTYPTVAVSGKANKDLPAFKNMKAYLKTKSAELGFDYADHGEVVVIGYGAQKEKLGIVTHGDVQPADPARWNKSPFFLDGETEADKWIARGTEDDKGPIATGLYAMKTIKDLNIPLTKRLELIISMTEESNWTPFREFVQSYDVPKTNIVIDSSYPVVVAEKAWCTIHSRIPNIKVKTSGPAILSFGGGAFISQVPETAQAELTGVNLSLLKQIKSIASKQTGMSYQFEENDSQLLITATGKSAHSASPESGINAVAHLAAILDVYQWPLNTAGLAVNYINQLIGTSYTGEKFGDIAYQDQFMGPMTVNLSTVKIVDGFLELAINMRRPVGKDKSTLESQINQALADWQKSIGFELQHKIYVQDAYYPQQATHVAPLLKVFSHFTGTKHPKPKSIGGSTHAKLMPNAVGFGPSMPNAAYTGHSEHEFITKAQFNLNLKMYTAAFVEIASK
jgi:dipeptidase D